MISAAVIGGLLCGFSLHAFVRTWSGIMLASFINSIVGLAILLVASW